MIKNRIIQKTPEDYLTKTSINELNSYYSQEKNKRLLRRKAKWEPWECEEFDLYLAHQFSEFLEILICYEEDKSLMPAKIKFKESDFGIACKATYNIPDTKNEYIMQYSAKISNDISCINNYNVAFAEFILSFSNLTHENFTEDIDLIFNKIHGYMRKNSEKFFNQR